MFGMLLQESSKREKEMNRDMATARKSQMKDQQKGTIKALRGQALEVTAFHEAYASKAKRQPPGFGMPAPGAPVNLLPPPPPAPTPPPPPDWREQPCPENPPCNCYCHCRDPPPPRK